MSATQLAHCGFGTKVDAIGFDEAAEQVAPLMRVRYVQLERGAAHVEGAIARLPRVLIGRIGGNRNSIVWLDSPGDQLSLFVPVRGLARMGMMTVEPQQAVLIGAATQVTAFTDRAFLPIVVTLDAHALAEVADNLKVTIESPDKLRGVRCLRIRQARMLRLDRLVQEMLQAALADPGQFCAADSLAALDDELVTWFTALLAYGHARELAPAGIPSRRRAALRAREFIDTHLDERLSLSQVCRASYASARALAIGFREMFGLSPMAYVRFARMARVRADLYLTPPHRCAVSALAHKWGFWQLNEFSKNYCALFGELPSTTLGRGAGLAAESARYAPRAAAGLTAMRIPAASRHLVRAGSIRAREGR